MNPRNGLLILTTLAGLLVLGCSRDKGGNFREYAQGGEVKSPATPTPRQQPKRFDWKPVRAQKPVAEAELAQTLPAAVGFGSRPVFSGTFRRTGEQFMTPAVGPGATLAMILKITGPERKTLVNAKVAEPRIPKVLIPKRSFQSEGPDGAVRVTYDDLDLLKVLNMDPVTPEAPKLMPAWLKGLNGKRIRIRGFMSPAFQQRGITSFLMGRDNKACCFPGRAKVYDLFPVKLRKGVTTNYIQGRPFDVVGIFYVKPWIEDGQVFQVYEIADAVVLQ